MLTDIQKKYVATFETSENPDDCKIERFKIIDIATRERIIEGIGLEEFIEKASFLVPCNIYVHDLKFYGVYFVDWLLKNGYKMPAKHGSKTFTPIINAKNEFFQINIQIWRNKYKGRLQIVNSRNIINQGNSSIAEKFGIDVPDGDVLYKNAYSLAAALGYVFGLGLKRSTIGGCAMDNYIEQTFGDIKTFRYHFPELSEFQDDFIRKAYFSGWCYLPDDVRGKSIGNGITLDYNTLYGYVMATQELPWGRPIYFEGKAPEDDKYYLNVQRFQCAFELKEGKFPFIRCNDPFVSCNTDEYCISTNGEIVELTLCSVDMELFLETYSVYMISYIDGYAFMSSDKKFQKYVGYWNAIKEEAEQTGNVGVRRVAKLMLATLGGKFGTRKKYTARDVDLDENSVLCVKGEREVQSKKGYLPVAVFMTAWARMIIIHDAEKVKDRYLYSDTDSLHLRGEEIPEFFDVDQSRIGAFKVERVFRRAKFLGEKCYIEDDEINGLVVKCSGLPEDCADQVTFENFERGAEYKGGKIPVRVPGGIIFKERKHCLNI